MSLTAFRHGWITIALLRGQNENTTEPRKCIRDFVFPSHSGTDLCACLWPVGESPDRRNSEGAWGQAQPLRAGGAKYILNIAADLKPGDVPFMPWAKSLVDQRADGSHSGEDPPANCLPRGVPRINASPPPWRVIQKSDIIGILYESDNAWRQIFLDGRELGNDFLPTYLGYSTG